MDASRWPSSEASHTARVSAVFRKLTTSSLASRDPYNDTEQLEMSWSDFTLDWTQGQMLIRSDVKIYVRTASKYDDLCLLHLPKLRFTYAALLCRFMQMSRRRAKYWWQCVGDPFDHHSLVPCAPNKLPELSQGRLSLADDLCKFMQI